MTTLKSLLDLKQEDLQQLTEKQDSLLATMAIMEVTLPETSKPAVIVKGKPLPGFPDEAEPDEPFMVKVIKHRLAWAGGEYSATAILFAAGLSTNPAIAVMWAYALWKLSHTGPVNINRLVDNEPESPFWYGVPKHEAYMRLWNEQKDRNSPLGNLLDNARTWNREPQDSDFGEVDVAPSPRRPKVESFNLPGGGSVMDATDSKLKLDNHPGYMGAFTTQQAEGAYPNGTRIIKQNSKKGDATKDGTKGKILGSVAVPPMPEYPGVKFLYFMEWDDKPKVAVSMVNADENGVRRFILDENQ
jgi:hypothetical protein